MTSYGLAAALVWAAVSAAVAWRLAQLTEHVVAVWRDVSRERVASAAVIAEMQATAAVDVARMGHPDQPHRPSALSGDVTLPDDLEAHVLSWNDEWAKDDERANLRRLYLELHTGNTDETWQRVRRSVGIGELP